MKRNVSNYSKKALKNINDRKQITTGEMKEIYDNATPSGVLDGDSIFNMIYEAFLFGYEVGREA